MDQGEGRSAWSERTVADLTSLLVELSRALKGLRFYEEDHPAHRDVLDRAYLAWRVELERTGPIEIRLDETGFRTAGLAESVPPKRLGELVEALGDHEVTALRFTPELTRSGLDALVSALAEEPRRLASRGGIAAIVAADGSSGITLPDAAPLETQPAAGSEEDPNETTQPMDTPAAASDGAGPATFDDTPLETDPLPDLDALAGVAPPPFEGEGAAASLGSSLLSASPLPLDHVDLPEAGAPVPLAPSPVPRRQSLSAPDVERLEIEPLEVDAPMDENTAPATGFEDFTKPALEEDPLLAPSTSEADEGLRRRLLELDACAGDDAYADLAIQAAAEALRLSADGHRDGAYRAILVFADHAVGIGGRSGSQALAAQERLDNLCTDDRLAEVMDRACDPEGSIGIRAAQVLLQLGGRAVAPLLDRLALERDEDRAAQIRSIVVALGERAAPIVVAAIRGDDPRRARIAVRLAGELQSSHLVPTLVGLLDGATPELRRDALRALAHIGGAKAVDAVQNALAIDRPGVPETAAACLGELGQRASVRPLMTRLDQAVADGSLELARAIVSSLGALGSEEAAPKLVSLLDRRALWNRSQANALRVPALEALARLPGREAARAVTRAVRHRDARVRQAAARLETRARKTSDAGEASAKSGGEKGGTAG